MFNRKQEKIIITIISVGFLLWSAAFIYRSSFVAIDGRRYFSLFDDAMISMRYAWNFSHGLGLVWNQGEFIEGYTNFLMTLLMSFATLVFDKSAAVLAVQVLGAFFLLIIAFVSMRLVDLIVQYETKQQQSSLRILTFFCVLAYYPLAYWSLMGMETGLLTILLLLGILYAIKYPRNENPAHLFLFAGTMGLAFLTRNESVIFTILIWAYIIWETPKSKIDRKFLRQFLASIGIYSLFIIGQLAFRQVYYGELLPNTYTLKLTGMPLFARLSDGVGFITPFLISIALMVVLSIIGIILDFRKHKILLLSIVFSTIGYQIYVGGDPWDHWRMMAPAFPLLTVLFISGINGIVLFLSGTFRQKFKPVHHPKFLRTYIPQILFLSLILAGLLLANRRFLRDITLTIRPDQVVDNQNNINIAIAIQQLTTSDATVGVTWAGSIPYYTDRRAIDFLGKTDRTIARVAPDTSGKVSWAGMRSVPGHNKYDINYSIKTLKPTYVQDLFYGGQDLTQWGKTEYAKVEYDGISLYLRKDSPAVLWSRINIP